MVDKVVVHVNGMVQIQGDKKFHYKTRLFSHMEAIKHHQIISPTIIIIIVINGPNHDNPVVVVSV
jgi:hypothetical protein